MASESNLSRPLCIGISCFPTFGGSGIVATEIGESLARRGHRVHFIAGDVPQRLDRFVENVFFHEVEGIEYPLFDSRYGGQGAYPLALASKMVEVAMREPLDVLHVHYAIPHAASALMATQILRSDGRPAPKVVTTLHGTDITLVGSDPSFLPITRYSVQSSDVVTAPSEALQRSTIERLSLPPSTAIEVIPNFVDTERFRPSDRPRGADLPDAVRHLFPSSAIPTSGRVRVLVHNSNFRPVKRAGDVIRALAMVRASMPVVLILIGDGPERSRCEELARELHVADAVCFLGKQLNFVEVLRASDVFLLPSETESFGLAALEAQSCGVPVVASCVGGVPEVVLDGETGILHETGDVAAMAAAISRLLGDDALLKRMRSASRARAVEKFRREPMVTRYEDLYRRVLS